MIDECAEITADVLKMVQEMHADKLHYRPYVIYGTPDSFGATRDYRKARRWSRRLGLKITRIINTKPRLYMVFR